MFSLIFALPPFVPSGAFIIRVEIIRKLLVPMEDKQGSIKRLLGINITSTPDSKLSKVLGPRKVTDYHFQAAQVKAIINGQLALQKG